MFVTFTYLFFFVDVDLRSTCVCGLFSGFSSHWTVRDFRECFEKLLHGRNLLLTIQNLFLLPRDIRFSTNEGVTYANVYKVLEVRVCCCVCVYGESLLTFGERGIQKTLIPFVLHNPVGSFITTINN